MTTREFIKQIRRIVEDATRRSESRREIGKQVRDFVTANPPSRLFPDVRNMDADAFALRFGASEPEQSALNGRIAPVIAQAETASKNFRPAVLDAVTKGLEQASRKGLEGDYRVFAREALRSAESKVHHLETEIETSLAAFDRASNIEAARSAGYEWFRYVGPSTNLRKFCAQHLGRVYHISEIQVMTNGQGLSVLYYQGGYNCRHDWEVVTEEVARQERPEWFSLRRPARDKLLSKFWNGDYKLLHDALETRRWIHTRLKGTPLEGATPRDIAILTGAPDGAEITIYSEIGRLRMEIEHPWFNEQEYVRILSVKNNEVILKNDLQFLSDAAKSYGGIGLRVLASQVEQATALGVSKIETVAGGNAGMRGANGYYTWIRYGFDADISGYFKRKIAQYADDPYNRVSDSDKLKMRSATTMLELFETEAGRNFWRDNGELIVLEFDLNEKSKSQKTLKKYLQEKGVHQ